MEIVLINNDPKRHLIPKKKWNGKCGGKSQFCFFQQQKNTFIGIIFLLLFLFRCIGLCIKDNDNEIKKSMEKKKYYFDGLSTSSSYPKIT